MFHLRTANFLECCYNKLTAKYAADIFFILSKLNQFCIICGLLFSSSSS